jgi:hypothetical protein
MSVEANAARRALLQLFGVLALTWAVLAANAVTKRDLSVFGVSIAKVDIEGYLRDPRAADAPGDRDAAIAGFAGLPPQGPPKKVEPRAAVVPAKLRVPDKAPQRILVFGDSMVKALMWRLSDYCAENGHEMFAASWYGSTTIAWAVQDKLDMLLAEHDPTFVIVVLGASEVPTRDVATHEKFIKQIVDKIGPRKLVWIGPPNTEPDTGINDLIEGVVGRERFFRSEGMDLPRYEDHIHPTAEGGRTWMDAVAHWISDESGAPIALATPSKPGPPPPTQIFQQGR